MNENDTTDEWHDKIASDLERVASAIRNGGATVDYATSADFQEETEIINLKVEWDND